MAIEVDAVFKAENFGETTAMALRNALAIKFN
jgi:hypothetical protein